MVSSLKMKGSDKRIEALVSYLKMLRILMKKIQDFLFLFLASSLNSQGTPNMDDGFFFSCFLILGLVGMCSRLESSGRRERKNGGKNDE